MEPWGLFVCRNANLVCQAHLYTCYRVHEKELYAT